MKLFWRERKAEQECAAREAMTKMDEMVNGKPKPKRPDWFLRVHCASDKIEMTQDPANVNRYICPNCHGVVVLTIERWAHGFITTKKSNP